MHEPSNLTLFRSVDLASFAAALSDRLRAVGVPVGLSATNRFSEAMRRCPPRDRATLYWVAKTTLLNDRRQFALFDALFDAAFGGHGLPIAPWERDRGRPSVKATGSVTRRSVPVEGLGGLDLRISTSRPASMAPDDDPTPDEGESVVPERLPAEIVHLADTSFDQLSTEDLSKIGRWLETSALSLPRRSTRRTRYSGRGTIDLRRTLRMARRTGEPLELARHRPRRELRPVAMVADISGSMEVYARVYLHLMRAILTNRHLAPDGRSPKVEVFAFTTTLRRITPSLRTRDPAAAIDRLTDELPDRFGGTRIAFSLGELLGTPRWSQSVRGATVLIASDGWDTDPPDELGRRMARLQRMAYRVIWINPRAAAADYQPAAAGMAAALPHLDHLLSGHSLGALPEVIDALTLR